MCSSCKSCKVFAAGLGWSCHDPWVNMSDVTDVMKNSTTCHVTTMGFSIGKRQVSPLRQVLTLWWWTSQVVFFVWQFRPGAHLSACVVFPNILWKLEMLNDWCPGVGLLAAVFDGFLGAQDDTSRPVMFLSNHRTGKRCRSVTSNMLFRVAGEWGNTPFLKV